MRILLLAIVLASGCVASPDPGQREAESTQQVSAPQLDIACIERCLDQREVCNSQCNGDTDCFRECRDAAAVCIRACPR